MGNVDLKNVMKLIEAANNEITIENQFLNDLTRSIEKLAEEDNKKPSQTYKPSNMNCERAMVYQVLGIEPDLCGTSYQSIGIAESGTDRHIRIQKAIENMKDCIFVDVADFVKSRNLKDLEIKGQNGMECKLYHKALNMSFMCDGIIRYNNKYFIFEFKTETSDKFYARKGVDEKHRKQAIAYSIAFGLDDVLFIYENRNVLDKKAYLLHITVEDRNDLLKQIGYCQSYVKENKIPPKPININKRICTYCIYKNKCKGEIGIDNIS